MKKLLLVRHAKSDWNNLQLSDFDRPLNARGHKAAPEMAQRFVHKNINPQQIVSSPAKRAITTANYFAQSFGIAEVNIVKMEEIYEASSATLMQIINQLDNNYNFIALFGHNPGISNCAMQLSGKYIGDMPTCATVLLEFPFDDWKMISAGTGDVLLYDYPKNGDD